MEHREEQNKEPTKEFDIVVKAKNPKKKISTFVKAADFGEYNWDNDTAAQNISMTIGMDYCVLNF